MNWRKKTLGSSGFISLLASFLSIAIGILFGYILLLIFNKNAANYGITQILTAGFSSPDRIAKTLYQAAPLMMTGLAVGFAFKTGLFNIGASGQYVLGAFFALTAVIQFQLPWYLALVFAMIGGAIWGAIPGIFKAYFKVNEVITSIMFNWIGLFTMNLCIHNMPMMLANYWGGRIKDRTPALGASNASGILPKLGLDQWMGNYINCGIFIAILFAIIMWVVLSKTTFGYELKACGYNRHASEYAGVNAKKKIVLSMAVSGALAGLGGGIYYLSGTAQYTLMKVLPATGFNGIPVALLAGSNPIGTIFSALFISYIQIGGDAMQPEFAKEIIDIIIAVIIYLSAFSLMVKLTLTKWLGGVERKKGGHKG